MFNILYSTLCETFSFSAPYEELQDLPKPGNEYFTKPGRSDETPQGNQAPVLFVLQNTYLSFHISLFLYFFFFTIRVGTQKRPASPLIKFQSALAKLDQNQSKQVK